MKAKTKIILLGVCVVLLIISVIGNIVLYKDLLDIRKKNAAMNDKFVTTDSQLTDLQNQLSEYEAIQTQVADLQKQIDDDKAQIGNLNSTITENNSTISDLEEQIKNQKKLLSEAQEQLENERKANAEAFAFARVKERPCITSYKVLQGRSHFASACPIAPEVQVV